MVITLWFNVQWSVFVQQYLRESEWNEAKYIPTFDEYVKSNIRSSGLDLASTNVLVFMDKDYEYEKYTDLFFFGNSFIRMKDDIGDFKVILSKDLIHIGL